jgi:hypothetical protein
MSQYKLMERILAYDSYNRCATYIIIFRHYHMYSTSGTRFAILIAFQRFSKKHKFKLYRIYNKTTSQELFTNDIYITQSIIHINIDDLMCNL